MEGHIFSCLLTLLIGCNLVAANPDAKRLYDDLLYKRGYDKLIRPVANTSQALIVKLGLKLSQIMEVDEKNEIIKLNMWVIHEWTDAGLSWDPYNYGNVKNIYVPSEMIWLPDIVLYNNAEGDYQITYTTKATLYYDGRIRWEPPAIYKSQCDIDVKYFPFDAQKCRLKLGSWSYDGGQVDVQHVLIAKKGLADDQTPLEEAIDMKNYYINVEWDVVEISSRKSIVYYPCCPDEPYPDVSFYLGIRRKTLFYTINLIVPCFALNMLTILVFYMPSASGEKISLSINILLSLSMFQLLLMDLVPPTSLTLPLLGKYLFFTTVLVSISVAISVITLNINFRSSSTHELPQWCRRLFLDFLPKYLLMKRPKDHGEDAPPTLDSGMADMMKSVHSFGLFGHMPAQQKDVLYSSISNINISPFCEACNKRSGSRLSKYAPNIQKGLDGVTFVSEHMEGDDDSKRVEDEWTYVAMVIDRIFLGIYLSVCSLGTIALLVDSPSHFDTAKAIT